MMNNKWFDIKEAIVFIKKSTDTLDMGNKDELLANFQNFCGEYRLRNTRASYKEYRSVYRVVYGIDLPMDRPVKKSKTTETQLDLF